MKGWLFDIYASPNGMTLWFISETGKRVSAHAPFIPKFYIHIDENKIGLITKIASRLGQCCEISKWKEMVEIYSGQCIKVLEILVKDTMNFSKCVKAFEAELPYYVFFNTDLSPVQMFLFEKDLFPLAYGEYTISGDGKVVEQNTQDSPDALDYKLPPLSIMYLKPSILEIAPKYQQNITLEVEYDDKNYIIEAEDAQELLTRLNFHIERCDPDLIISHYGDSSIFPWLVSLSSKFKVPLKLNRDPTAPFARKHDVSYWSYGQIIYKAGSFELAGRWHLDVENSFIIDQSDLPGLFELARLTRIPIQRQARETIGTGLSSLQLAWAYKHNILIPSKKQEWEQFKSGYQLLLSDRGGLIFLPKIGYHENVAELDFASMYPTLMCIHNISPETVNCQCCSNQKVPELGYTLCENRKGIVPETLEAVLSKRTAYKKREKEAKTNKEKSEYHQRQIALKWLLVTCFGYLGYKNARFGRIEAHESVNAFSRDALLKAKAIAEERGFEIVHGIVDCLWLKKDGASADDYIKLSDEISKETGVSISFDGIYKWILFPNSRTDPEIPTSNRYVGVYTNNELKVRGLEVRRGDAPLFVKKVQADVLKLMTTASGIEELKHMASEIIQVMKIHLERLATGRVDPLELVIKRTISKEADEYMNQSMQAIVAKTMAEEGVALMPGETAEFIIIDSTGKKYPQKVKPFLFYKPEDGYDIDKYTELTIKSIEILLNPLGYDYDWIAEQLITNIFTNPSQHGIVPQL
ncbi:MAG: DNA polymerase domain-containing protein [Candidatus Kryptoniota bacterium]